MCGITNCYKLVLNFVSKSSCMRMRLRKLKPFAYHFNFSDFHIVFWQFGNLFFHDFKNFCLNQLISAVIYEKLLTKKALKLIEIPKTKDQKNLN